MGRISQRLFNMLPNLSISNSRVLRAMYKTGDVIGRPMENRLIMGAAAIMSQPYIDEHNKKVDKDTARASRNRTIAKIVAGTTVGVIVRGGVFWGVKQMTKLYKKNAWDQLLMPASAIGANYSEKAARNALRNYRTAISTILATVIMFSTNILFDLPFTNKISNLLNEHDAKKKKKNSSTERHYDNAMIVMREKFKTKKENGHD